nr:lipocalin family protein [Pseudomonas sp.]
MPQHPYRTGPSTGSVRWPLVLLGAIAVTGLVACAAKQSKTAHGELPVQEGVELSRYVGTWYEQARLPNSFQKDCQSNVQAHYTLLPENRMWVVNRCKIPAGEFKSTEGVARLASQPAPPNPARLQVRFAPEWTSWIPAVWGDYWIIKLDESYQYSLVGTPDRKYLWVLTRQKRADQAKVDELLEYARSLGFAVDEVMRTVQEG